VESVGGENWAAAVKVLKEGGSIVFRGIGLTRRQPDAGDAESETETETLGPLVASIFTEWSVDNLNEVRAKADVARGQQIVQELLAESSDVREVASAGIQFELVYDYGLGSLLIARIADGRFVWYRAPWRDD
jgi:hypothetical protein